MLPTQIEPSRARTADETASGGRPLAGVATWNAPGRPMASDPTLANSIEPSSFCTTPAHIFRPAMAAGNRIGPASPGH